MTIARVQGAHNGTTSSVASLSVTFAAPVGSGHCIVVTFTQGGSGTSNTVTDNAGPGVIVQDLSMVSFNGASVTHNGGGMDVACNPQYPATRGVADTGAITNCVEP